MLKKIVSSLWGQIVILFLLCLTLVVLWFGNGKMYAGGEEGLNFYNLTKYLTLATYSWYEVGTGFQLFTLLPKLPFYSILEFLYRSGMGAVQLQALTFLILMFIGCFSVYMLIKQTVGKDLKGFGRYVPLLSGIFYLLNPYSMSQVWGRGIYSQFFAFALVPLFLYLFIAGLQKKSLIYAPLAIFSSLFLSSIYTFPGNVLLLWSVVFLYLFFYFRRNLKNRSNLSFGLLFFLVTFSGWMLTNIFWILPYLQISNQQYTGFVDTNANIASLQGVSRSFPFVVLIRLMQNTYFDFFYGTIYKSIPFQIISFLIPLVSFFSLNKFKALVNFNFYIAMFLFGLFINLGANFPSGWLFEIFFKSFPVLQMFRNPYEKLGLILALSYAPFFAIGLVEISNRIARKFDSKKIGYAALSLIVILVNGIFEWPMWLGYFAGGFWANPWIDVPRYYKDADLWLQMQGGSGLRLLQLPLNPGDGIKYEWDHPYSGIEPSEVLFTSSSIGRNVAIDQAKVYYNALIERFGFASSVQISPLKLSNSEFKSSTLLMELEKLGIGYIILHNDVNTNYSGMKTVDETVSVLSKEIGIKRVNTFGKLEIFKVGSPQERSIIYSKDGPLRFTKKSPTEYLVEVKKADKPFDLYFLQLFDLGWEAFINGVQIENHKKVYDYANLWQINTKGDYTIVIKYKAQEIVEKGNRISLFGTIILVLLSGMILLRKRVQHEK